MKRTIIVIGSACLVVALLVLSVASCAESPQRPHPRQDQHQRRAQDQHHQHHHQLDASMVAP